MRMDKESVRQNFSQSAATYDCFSDLHDQIMDRLFSQLTKDYKKILDIGSGTGTFAGLLAGKYPGAEVLGIDIAPGMVDFAASKVKEGCVKFLVGDGEFLPFGGSQFDLVVSSASLQWMDLEKVFAEVCRVLRQDGDFCFSTFGPRTLWEIKRAGLAVNDLPSGDRIKEILGGYFKNVDLCEEVMIRHYNNVYELFNYLKAIGAQNPQRKGSRGLLTRSKLDALFLKESGIDVTFEVYYGCCQKNPH